MKYFTSSCPARRARLWVGLSAALALAPASRSLLAVEVMNCGDGGPGSGSLRDVIANAAPGETIDLSQLPTKCGMNDSVITLLNGEIVIAQDDLKLQGPSIGSVTIQPAAGVHSRVLNHTGHGLLVLNDLRIANGDLQLGPNEGAYGGCIRSLGTLFLAHSKVTNCTASAGYAQGGGIYAEGSAILLQSVVSGNTANGTGGGGVNGSGGGILAHQSLSLLYSTLSNNEASGGGGGAVTSSQMPGVFTTVSNSTIDGNRAAKCGGAYFQTVSGVTISSSTVSGNTGTEHTGGICTAGAVEVVGSTISFNTGGMSGSGGLFINSGSLNLQSSILARNSAPILAADLYAQLGVSVGGTYNLIMSYNSNVPGGTATTSDDPLLAPLGYNGGPTRTHALLPGSPAIGTGDNYCGFYYDQRGPGYPRTTGPNATTDIGAFQFDSIFYGDFDG